MTAMTDRAMETWKAAMEARLFALQKQVDAQDERIAALIETKNLLMGDRQRQQAEEMEKAKASAPPAEKHPTPVQRASATRRAADKRAEERRNG